MAVGSNAKFDVGDKFIQDFIDLFGVELEIKEVIKTDGGYFYKLRSDSVIKESFFERENVYRVID